MNLENWIRLGRQHWKEHLPTRYAELKAAGTLDEALRNAAEQTYLEVNALEEQGLSPDEAWQAARQNHLLLPPETNDLEPTDRPALSLMRELQQAQSHAMRALDDPDYEIPNPPEA